MGSGESSESEEVASGSQSSDIHEGGGGVEVKIARARDCVELVVISHWQLGVEHEIGHGIVGVPEVVLGHIVESLVEIPIEIRPVPLEFVGVDEVITEQDDGVLEGTDVLSLGIEIEGHVIVPFNAQEQTVQSKQGVSDGLLL